MVCDALSIVYFIFQGATSCSYCLHKREKTIKLKKVCTVKTPDHCEFFHDIHKSNLKCYNCEVMGPETKEEQEL